MLRKLVPFRTFHYGWLNEAEAGPAPSPALLAQLEQQNSWTFMIDGEVIACAGTTTQWPGRHAAWAVLDQQRSGRHMGWITRETRKNLDGVKGRIEMTVRTDFPQGLKWARMLGFRIETPRLERYGPDGEDHVGFVRINYASE